VNTRRGVAEVSVAAPAVAQIIFAGVVAGVRDRHQETSSEQLDVISSSVWRNKPSVLVELSSFFVNFETSCVHTTLHASTLGGGNVRVTPEREGTGQHQAESRDKLTPTNHTGTSRPSVTYTWCPV